MRHYLLGGVAALALLPAPLLAQEATAIPDQAQAYPESGETIDTVVDLDENKAPAPTGDPVLDRLNALEAKVRQLEARIEVNSGPTGMIVAVSRATFQPRPLA